MRDGHAGYKVKGPTLTLMLDAEYNLRGSRNESYSVHVCVCMCVCVVCVM